MRAKTDTEKRVERKVKKKEGKQGAITKTKTAEANLRLFSFFFFFQGEGKAIELHIKKAVEEKAKTKEGTS